MKQKLLINHKGNILNVLDADRVLSGSKTLTHGRYEKVFDLSSRKLDHIKHRRMHIDKSGKLALLPEEEWPETIEAKQELFEDDKSKLKAQIDDGNFTKNPDGSVNLPAVVADLIQKKVL